MKTDPIPVQVRLPEPTRRLLAIIAAERGITQSAVVAELVEAQRTKVKR